MKFWKIKTNELVLTIFLVNLPMSLQCESIGKRGRTYITFKRFLTRMHLCVIFQVGRLAKCRSACVTFIRFLARMNSSMIPKRRMSCKSFITNFANVRLLAAMRSFVIFQVRRLWELHATRCTSGTEKRKEKKEKINNFPNQSYDIYSYLMLHKLNNIYGHYTWLTCMASRRYVFSSDSSNKPLSQKPAHKWYICNSFRRCAIFCATTNLNNAKRIHHKCYNETVSLVGRL